MTYPIVHPYLFFSGCCEEAIEFYHVSIGARVEMIMRFKEAPEPPPPDMLAAGYEDKIMHASFFIGSCMIMASDGCGDKENFSGFTLSLTVETEEEADQKFAALAEGGEVTMPLGKTFWSPRFGMLKDKFGIAWMINLAPESADTLVA